MFGNAYRAIVQKEDGSFKVDGYLIMERMYDGHGKVEIYSSDLSLKESRYPELKKLSNGSYDTGDFIPKDDRGYILMDNRDMEDLLAMRRAISRLNCLESRQWTVASQGMDVCFCVESISGGKIHIADFIREGRVELRSEHSMLVRHFVGAVNREGIRMLIHEPDQISQGMYERMAGELCEIADKYGLLCERIPRGEWCLGIRELPRRERELLYLTRGKAPSKSIVLSSEAPEIMRAYLANHPAFTQEEAWSLADDLNGLYGRVTPTYVPVHDRHEILPAFQLTDLFEPDALHRLPHAADAEPVRAWDLEQARLRGTDEMIRDCMIGFVRNLDNRSLGDGSAVRYLGDMIARYRLDTVRKADSKRLREITDEALSRARQSGPTAFTHRQQDRNGSLIYADWKRMDEGSVMMVAEDPIIHQSRRTAVMQR